MTTKITRINQIAKERPKEVFTSIYHLINEELLKECYIELDGTKATGLDKITKEEYGNDLENKIKSLVAKLKNMSYRPSPAKKINIPKANGKLRGLAIANFEDKIVQLAVKKIVEAIYEPKLTNNMFGFRVGKSCHQALRYVSKCIEERYTNFVLDADIKGYFDNINHELIMKALEVHIKDKNLLRLIKRFLKAGIMENGQYIKSEYGTPQGSILSPVLANIVMYYGIILYIERIKKTSKGYVEIINYADDMILCFQYEKEAEEVYKNLKERLNKLGLEFAEDKTRLIEFGRFAEENQKKKIGSKSKTFNFLGFTHYCSKSKQGKFRVKRKTAKKKLSQKLVAFNKWMKEMRNKTLGQIFKTIERKLVGYYNYYGITDNIESLIKYWNEIRRIMFKWLNRRSNRKSYTWEGFQQLIDIMKLSKPSIKVNIYKISLNQ